MTHHSDKIVRDINQPEKHTHRCSRHPLVGDALDTTTLLAPLDEQNKLKMKSILSYYYSLNPALKTVFLDDQGQVAPLPTKSHQYDDLQSSD